MKVAPNSFKSYKSYAYALYEIDPHGENIDEIIRIAEKALEITDRTQIVFLHLGAYYRIKADRLANRTPEGGLVITSEAVPWYQKSVAMLERAVVLDRQFNAENRRKEIARGRDPARIMDVGNHEIYWNLGLGYMRLGMHAKALESFAYMRHLAPTNPDAYFNLGLARLALGQTEEATVMFLQALLLDSNRLDALRLIVELYRKLDAVGCAVLYKPEPVLNADCPLVYRHLCRAYQELAETFHQARHFDLAAQAAQAALSNYRCPREPLERFLKTAQPAS